MSFLKSGGDGFRPVYIDVGSFSLQFLLCCVSQSSDKSRKAGVMFFMPDIHVSVVSACSFCYVVFPNHQKELLIDISRGVGSCNSCILDFLLICLSFLSFFVRWR